MQVRYQILHFFLQSLRQRCLHVIRDFLSILPVAIADSKIVEGRLSPKNVGCEYEGVLVLLERVVWDVAHPGGKGKLGDDILGLPEESLD